MAAETSDALLVRVLGPIDVVIGGEVVAISGRCERKLLGALAISANHGVVSSDHLAEILWRDNPPASRDNTLQTHLSHLRRLLGTSRIECENHGYRLCLDNDELDALEFERLAAEAADSRSRPGQCLLVCRQALGLWRGVPFGDFVDEDPFRLEAIRLEEHRLSAVEFQLESEIALGRGILAIGSLESLVEEYPYRERLWYLLALELARCGRRVEAIRACIDLRHLLEEVGLEPSMAMRKLEEEILAESPNVRTRLLPDALEDRSLFE